MILFIIINNNNNRGLNSISYDDYWVFLSIQQDLNYYYDKSNMWNFIQNIYTCTSIYINEIIVNDNIDSVCFKWLMSKSCKSDLRGWGTTYGQELQSDLLCALAEERIFLIYIDDFCRIQSSSTINLHISYLRCLVDI